MRKPVNAAARTAQLIKQHIIEGDLKSGDKLPPIDRLAKQVGVSRPTVREALQLLVGEGIVTTRQGVGTTVTNPGLLDALRTLSSRTFAEGISVSELHEARKWITMGAIRLATEKASAGELAALAEQWTSPPPARGAAADGTLDDGLPDDFAVAVTRLTKNRFLIELAVLMRELLLFAAPGSSDGDDSATETAGLPAALLDVEEMIEAMGEGDGDRAARLMGRYLDRLHRAKRTRNVIIYCDAFGTGSVGGSFYNVGQTISQTVSRRTWIKPSVQPTGGGIDNVRLTEKRQIGLGIAQADVALAAYHGRDPFKRRHQNIRVVCSVRGLDLQIFTLAGTGINTIEDLKHKRLAIGAHGGASVGVSRAVLGQYGLQAEKDYFPHHLPFATATAMLAEGEIDAVFFLSSGQSPALVELALTEEVRFLAVDQTVIEHLTGRFPYWYASSIPALTYPHQEAPVTTVGLPTILITHKDVRDEDMYAITKAIFRDGRRLDPKPFLDVLDIPHHPGAARYFLEEGLISRET